MTSHDQTADIWPSDDDVALLHRLADAARTAIQPHFRAIGGEVTNKSVDGFDPVTRADMAAELAMRRILAEERPEDGVLGEECDDTPSASGRVWVLDPIDGTRGFIAGLVTWGVLIALNIEGRAVLGALDQPYIGERFIGRLGPDARSFLQRGESERPLRVRPCAALSEATLLTTAPELFQSGAEAEAYGRVARAVRLARYGTDCYGYAMTALGTADLVVEAGLRAFDIQALVPIVEAAGGIVTTWDGGRPEAGGRIVAAGDKAIHAAALELLAL